MGLMNEAMATAGSGVSHDFQSIEAELVECVDLWYRSPGGGAGGWATDAPWYLMERDTNAGDYDKRGGDMETPAPKPLPLNQDEVAKRDTVSGWLGFIPEPANRKLVIIVAQHLARGESDDQISWVRVLKLLGERTGAGHLRQRYNRAIHRICLAVNAGEEPKL